MDQIKNLLSALSMRQRWTIAIAILVAGAGMYALTSWQREANFRPLYNSLAPEDASVVVQKLKESGTPYRISSSGTTISVPEEKVAELRLEMAGAGVPKSGRIGFEIFDKTNFGMTDFAEHVNYRRALEGELERSIMSVTEVEQARVHISLPQESVFLEGRQPAKASVLVKIRSGAALPDTAMPAITNLVASAVEGLAPENVSVLDMRGNLLNRPKRAGAKTDESSDALEYQHKIEQDLAAKLDSTLEPVVGQGRFRTAVSAECDITSGEQSEENFDPTHSVMVSSQKSEDTSTPTHAAGGVPGTAANLPDSAARPPVTGGGTSRKTESVNYQTAHTVKRTVLPQGAIKRLSISVLIDQEMHWEGSGANAKRVVVPPTPERIKIIHDLAVAATGFKTERGDQLIVESLPFESTLNVDPPGNPVAAPVAGKKLTPLEQLKSDPKMMGGLAAIFAIVIGGIFFVIRKMMKKPQRDAEVRTTQALPHGAAEANLERNTSGNTAWVESASSAIPLSAGRVEVLTNQLRSATQKDAEVYAGVLRGWLKEEKA